MDQPKDIATLRAELSRCEKEREEAIRDARASHARLSATLIRLGRAQRALELAIDEAEKGQP
jgi:hypothetical protein